MIPANRGSIKIQMHGSDAWWLSCGSSQYYFSHCLNCFFKQNKQKKTLSHHQSIWNVSTVSKSIVFYFLLFDSLLVKFLFKRGKCPWFSCPPCPSHSHFNQMTKLKSVLTPWLTSVTRLSRFTNRHLQNSLHVALFKISALRCSVLASASEAKPIYRKYSCSPSSPTTSLYLKRWLIMLGPCVFIYLLSKPSRVLALKWEKALRRRPFAERGWLGLCGGGQPAGWSWLIRCSLFRTLLRFKDERAWLNQKKQTDFLFFSIGKERNECVGIIQTQDPGYQWYLSQSSLLLVFYHSLAKHTSSTGTWVTLSDFMISPWLSLNGKSN